jgi:eukaryotic-like serine/threonine-protein kinase
MPQPATLNATVELILESQLVPEDRLRGFLSSVRGKKLAKLTPIHLLQEMVAVDLLTAFRARQIATGRSQGFVLGKYRILDMVGRGGMGQIYRAQHIELKTEVALKVLSTKAMTVPLAHKRFIREAEAAARISHPNVVRIYDVSPNSDPPYLVMEYIEGFSLQAMVAREGPLSVEETLCYAKQIALGLQQISLAGLVHRDIKPANVLVTRQGDAKILDLGIVYINSEPLTKLSKSDTLLGTLDYLAPEQAVSNQVDIRADLYSLGATLYFLLTGQPPFPGGDPRSKILRIYNQPPLPLRQFRGDIPETFTAIIDRLLAKTPQQRYHSPQQLWDALQQVKYDPDLNQLDAETQSTISEFSSRTPPVTTPERNRTVSKNQTLNEEEQTVELNNRVSFEQNLASLSELTLRTQIDAATAEAVQRKNSGSSRIDVETRRERLHLMLGWAAVAAIVGIVGVGTVVKLLLRP